MMPRPTIPTLPFAIASLPTHFVRSFPRKRESRIACSEFAVWVPAFAGTNGCSCPWTTLHGGCRRVQAQCGGVVQREGCLSRARVIPYGRRPLPQRCGGAGGNPQ